MALVGKEEIEIESKSSADKLFQIFRSRAHQIPNICPEKIPAIHVHEGDWETPGSVKSWNYVLDEKAATAKETIEAIDEENKTIIFNVFEGDVMKDYKSFKSIVQFTSKGDGSLVKWSIDYEKLNEDVDTPRKYLDFAATVLKDIDAHLLKA